MPLTRYQIRNEYGLADPELYKAAERDDPEALLEGVAMAGLVGVLRQLGDLAEFAAEIFHDLHEEVVATAARGHGLVARVQQLEADFPSIEKAFLSQTSHSPFFSAPGIDWHPNMRSQQNLVTRGDLPRFVMDSYEECRGPPRLFLLDKFDVAGAGACLKRYTDPSFFKVEAKSHKVPTGDAQREKKMRKVKKKAARMRNGETSGIAPTSHSKLHQLLMEERIENGYNNPPRALKIKKRNLNGYPFDSKTGKSYMVQFVETPSPEHKVVHEVPVSPPRLKFRSSSTSQTAKDVSEVNTVNHVRKSPQRNERSCSPPYAPEVQYKSSIDDDVKEEVVDRLSEVVPVLSSDGEIDETPSSPHEVMDKKIYGYPSDDVTSDVDNYVDARTTLESEIESGNEFRIKNDSDAYEDLKFQTDLADSESVANSSASTDDNGSFKKGTSSVSFSDTSTSNLAENAAPSDGDEADEVSPLSEHGVAEVMEAPSNKLSARDALESESDEIEVPSEKFVEEVKIPDTKLSTGEIAEPQYGELEVPNDTNIEEVKITDTRATSCGTISSSSDETELNLADSSDVFSSIPSQNRDYILSAVPDQTDAVDKLNNGDLGFISDAQLHSSNVSEGASENKGSDCSGSEVLQVIDTDRNCTESINSGEIGSVSPTDEVLFSGLPEVEASSVTVAEVDYAISSTEVNLESLAPMVDVPEPCNSTEEQLSGIPDDVPQLNRNITERSESVDNQETDRPSCNADDTEEEAVPLEVPCHSNYADLEDCVVETEAKQEVNQLEVVSKDPVSYGESKSGVLDDAEDISVTEQDQNSLLVGDVTTTSIPSQVRNHVPEPMPPQPDDLLEDNEDALPSSNSFEEPGVRLQEFSSLQVDQVHMENLQVHEEQLQSPIYTDKELHFDVSKSSPEDLPDQAAFPELSQQSQAIGLTDSSLPNFPREPSPTEFLLPAGLENQAVDGLHSSLPFFGIFPEATPDHMEMPPLPPLPPMQWRMGKVHNTPFPSLRGSFQCNQDSCDTVPSSGVDEKEKLEFLPAVEEERSYTLQVPNMDNDLAAEVRQSSDTFLTSPAISDDRAAQASHMWGGEMIQSSYIPLPLQAVGDATSTHDPESSQGNLMQPPNQLAAETASDAKMLEHISKDVEGQGDTSLYTFAPPPSIEDEQPRNGEIAWYPKTSAFVPFFEVPKQNGNSTMKIPRPRSPLIDAVAAHDKSTLRKVTERVRPQNEPKVGERDSLLEQIRTKSFSLKPAVVTRPSIQGPKTNLKVAAILEKANAIRQALAGSDDDDDTESNWSDS